MHDLKMTDTEKLVRAIRDPNNPGSALAALATTRKLLLENELGALQMAPDVRSLLELALLPDNNF